MVTNKSCKMKSSTVSIPKLIDPDMINLFLHWPKTRSARSRTNKQEWWILTVKTKIKEASKNNIYHYKSILCNMYLCISFRLSQMVHSLSKISLANSKRKYQFNCMLQILPFTLLFNYLLIWYPDKSCYQIPYSLGMQDSCHLTLIGTLIPNGPH